MKFKSKIILAIMLCLLIVSITSCISNENDTNSKHFSHESQLYASLTGYFNYHYSMDLWSFEEVLLEFCKDNVDVDRYRYYIIGKIDLMLSYSENYLIMTYNGQHSLSHKILSKDLYMAISSYVRAKREYLETLKNLLLSHKGDVDEDIVLEYNTLSNNLQSLNISIEDLGEKKEKDYIEIINQTVELIERLKAKLMEE